MLCYLLLHSSFMTSPTRELAGKWTSLTEYEWKEGCVKEIGFGKSLVQRTDLRLGYQGAFSITQRREGQTELRLSITLTKIERKREDILKGIPHITWK